MSAGRAALVAAALAVAAPADAATYRLRIVEVVDQTGFERPMVAVRIAIPADWAAEGAVIWQIGNPCATIPVGVRFIATSPDRRQAFEVWPTLNFAWDNMAAVNQAFARQMQAQMQALGVPYMPPAAGASGIGAACHTGAIGDAGQMLRAVGLGELRPGARPLDLRQRPDLVAPEPIPPVQRSPQGFEVRNIRDVAELLVGYSVQGGDFVEVMRGYFAATQTAMPDMTGAGMPMVSGQGTGRIYAFRAPAGQLDFRLAEVIAGSIALDRHWEARFSQVMGNIQRTAQTEIARRSDIVRRSNDDISRMIVQGYEERSRAQDRMAENYGKALRGQEIYLDRRTGDEITLPNTHAHSWRLTDGSYVLTDDPSFNPYRELRMEGYQLEPVVRR